MGVIAEHPSELVRDQYLMEVASRTRIDPAQLRAGNFARPARGAPPRGRVIRNDSGSHRSRPRVQRDSPETEALRLMLADPGEITGLLVEALFADDLNLAAYRALSSTPMLRDAVESADPPVADLLQRLAVEDTEAEVGDVIGRLVEEAASRELVIIQSEVAVADDADVFARSGEMAWVKLRMEELREPATSLGAGVQLLAWLAQRPQEFT